MNDWDKQLAAELEAYTDEVAEKVKRAIDKTAEGVMNAIKSHISFKQRTGKYVRAFRLKTSYESRYDKRITWYVAGAQARLTHLLENGHAARDGSRVKAYPHIKYGEAFAEDNLSKTVEDELNE